MSRCLLVYCGLLLLVPFFASAVTDEVVVRTQVGSDTSPPTTPTLLTATPISTSQINLTWSASTDDFELSGYTVRRDGLHIATTTLTSYSDTGLTASTTYEYEVTAFDWMGNLSTTSNALSTTTLETPPSPPPTETATSSSSGTSASGRLRLVGDEVVTPTGTTAAFLWQTNRPSRYVVRFGRTDSYELGYVTSDRLSERHETTLGDLTPGTTYYYEIEGFNAANDIPQLLVRGQFSTTMPPGEVRPPNVARLMATVTGSDVRLSWELPVASPAYEVRVVRSHLGYPLDPLNGMIVYQGSGGSLLDTEALLRYGTQYYTVFVIGEGGAISTGAVVRADRFSGGTQPGPPTTTSPTFPPTLPDLPLRTLPLSAIELRQGAEHSTFADEAIVLDAHKPFTLRIPYGALPQHLKSIIVTLYDPRDPGKSHAFLLRLTAAGDAYETTLAPVAAAGPSYLLIEVYDFETQVVGRYGKRLTFTTAPAETPTVIFPDWFLLHPLLTGGFLLFIFLIVILLLFWRRTREEANTSRHAPRSG